MLNIAILDDKIEEATRTKELLLPYMEKRRIEMNRMDIFFDGISLLSSSKVYDMLFLDIEVGSENGIEIAKELRIKQPDIIIIVITSFIKYSIEGYKIHAARYLLKPIAPSLLYSELDEVMQVMMTQQSIIVRDHHEDTRLRIHDIYYFESYGRKTQFHLRAKIEVSNENVSHWAIKLHPAFVECYKGIYVHVKYIEQISKDTIQLENKQILPLARRRVEDVHAVWMKYQEISI